MKLPGSIRALFSCCSDLTHTGREGIHEEVSLFFPHAPLKENAANFCENDFFKSICVLSFQTHRTCHIHRHWWTRPHTHTHINNWGTHSVVLLIPGKSKIYMGDHCSDWSPNSSENDLSFIPTPLSPLQKFPAPWSCACVMTRMCLCVVCAVCAVSLSEDPQSSFHELQRRICSQPAPSGSITLCCVWDRNQKLLQRRPKIYLSPLNVKSLHHIVRTPSNGSLGASNPAVFLSHLTYSIALCCTSKWNQKLLRRKRKVIFFHSFKCKVVLVITPHRHSPPRNLES